MGTRFCRVLTTTRPSTLHATLYGYVMLLYVITTIIFEDLFVVMVSKLEVLGSSLGVSLIVVFTLIKIHTCSSRSN